MALPGFTVAEIDPIVDNGERWFGLQAHFPDQFASHSLLQKFYFGSGFLLRRHDYCVDVAGGFAEAGPQKRAISIVWRTASSRCPRSIHTTRNA